ncbi:MAG: hypothetical protein O3B13_14180 [Planctomycetota bacterium]|nr:hypothetical protein [Planctomycetota bacterium]MDA1164243.1 hypothetical protein [Planctomycetota bacterium]
MSGCLMRKSAGCRCLTTLITGLSTLLFVASAVAQSRLETGPAPQRSIRTEVSCELLMATRVPPLAAQRWGEIFRRAGASVRIRQALGNDRAEITETTRGSLRQVKAVGLLDKDGSIIFENRRFQESHGAALAEWIRELKTYGAQGSDEGKPGYGLSREQFAQVFRTLAAKVLRDPAGLDLPLAIERLDLPAVLPLRMTPAAQQLLQGAGLRRPAPEGLSGLSRGTVLAILLNNAGLGFRPGRTPEGSLELRVDPLSKQNASWPIGWPLEKPPITSMPKLVEFIPVELDNVPLTDVILAISAKTEIPILTDHRRISEGNIPLDKLKVSQDYRKMTWSGLLDRVTFPDLMRELLQDEAGTPFVWITTRTVTQLNERARQREQLLDQKAK